MPPGTRSELCVVGAAAPSAAIVLVGLDGPGAAALTVCALLMSLLPARAVVETDRTPRALWPAVLMLGTLAATTGPIGSHDLWSYSFYGRMVSEYRVDPYRAVPAMFPHDAIYPVVGWRHTASGYGPLFTLYSAAVTKLAGGSKLVMRLGFQLVAAASVTWCLWVLSRARRHAALTLVALQPFIWVSVVNGGHNNAIVSIVSIVSIVAPLALLGVFLRRVLAQRPEPLDETRSPDALALRPVVSGRSDAAQRPIPAGEPVRPRGLT